MIWSLSEWWIQFTTYAIEFYEFISLHKHATIGLASLLTVTENADASGTGYRHCAFLCTQLSYVSIITKYTGFLFGRFLVLISDILTEDFHGLPQYHQENAGAVPHIRPQILPFHYSLFVLPFIAIWLCNVEWATGSMIK
jgi:hypothetical protein